MKFSKFFAAGKDYIQLSDSSSCDTITIKNICNRFSGAGADGIFIIHKNSAASVGLSVYDKNGQIMQDHSTAAVCACYDLFTKGSNSEISIYNEKYNKTYINSFHTDNGIASATLYARESTELFSEIKRKTEMGNRILTITPVFLHSIYGVHFTDNRKLLNIKYLGEHFSRNSLFRKSGNLILAEKTDDNTFCFDFYENKSGCTRGNLSAFGAVALAACKEGLCDYNTKLKIISDNSAVYVTCTSENTVKQKAPSQRCMTVL